MVAPGARPAEKRCSRAGGVAPVQKMWFCLLTLYLHNVCLEQSSGLQLLTSMLLTWYMKEWMLGFSTN